MNVKIRVYTPQSNSDTVNHNITFQFILDQTERNQVYANGIIYFENKGFSLEGFSNTHYIRKLDQCPFLRFALLESWSWRNVSDADGNGKSIWECDCTYISPAIYDISRPPYARTVKSYYTIQQIEEVADKAYPDQFVEGEVPTISIETTAGEPFTSPPLFRNKNEIVFSIEKNYALPVSSGENSATKIQDGILSLINTVNYKSVNILGFEFEVNQAMIQNIEPRTIDYIEHNNGTYTKRAYINAVYKIVGKLNKGETFDLKPVNAGFLARPAAGQEAERITTDGGAEITSPKKLNSDGLVLGDGEDPVFLNFRINPYYDFNNLGLPATTDVNYDNRLWSDGNVGI